MYRCTECKALYEEYPQFCECGNDVFEEVYVQPDEEEEEEVYEEVAPVRKKPQAKKLSPEEIQEIEEEKRDKKKALITLGICSFIALIMIFLPPYPAKKSDVVAKSAETEPYSKLPAVSTYWDTSVPSYARSKDPYYNLPVLNKNLSRISPVLREYLINIGREFDRQWNSASVSGNGEARIAFVVNKDGILEYKTLSVKSNNESLDDSVLLVLSKISSLETPPDDYKGEKIILSFVTKDGGSKVQFPTN